MPPASRPRVAITRGLALLRAYDVLVLAAAIWFLGKFIRYAFPPLFETFQGRYGVSNATIGLAFSAFMGLYALMQFPSGALADRFGSRQVITGGAVVAGLGSLALLLEPPFVALVLAMAVMGLGTGAHKTVAIRLLSETYPRHVGRSLGVFDTIGTAGGVVAPVLVAAVLGLAVLDWPVLFGAAGAVVIVVAVTFFIRLGTNERATREPTTDTGFPTAAYRRTFRRPRILAFIGMTICMAFAYNGLVSFLPLYLTTEAGLSTDVASLLYSVLFIASISQLFAGEAADRFGPLRTLLACLIAATAGLALLVLVVSATDGGPLTVALLLGVVVLIGLGSHGYRPPRDVYLVELMPADIKGGGLGVVRTLLMGSGAIAPTVVGVVADWRGFPIAFLGLVALGGVAVLIAATLALSSRIQPEFSERIG